MCLELRHCADKGLERGGGSKLTFVVIFIHRNMILITMVRILPNFRYIDKKNKKLKKKVFVKCMKILFLTQYVHSEHQ